MNAQIKILSDQLIQCAKIIEDLRNEVPVVDDEIDMCLTETSEALEMVSEEDRGGVGWKYEPKGSAPCVDGQCSWNPYESDGEVD